MDEPNKCPDECRSASQRSTLRYIILDVIALALLAAGVLAAILYVSGAPLPARKPQPAKPAPQASLIPGVWDLHWQGGVGRATFHAQGGYECLWELKNGSDWIGSWTMKGNTITVTEAVKPSRPDATPHWYTWSALMVEGTRRGELTNGGNFELRTPKATD